MALKNGEKASWLYQLNWMTSLYCCVVFCYDLFTFSSCFSGINSSFFNFVSAIWRLFEVQLNLICMMVGCSVKQCKNRSDIGYAFYRFPRDPARRREWEFRVNRPHWHANEQTRICSVSPLIFILFNIFICMMVSGENKFLENLFGGGVERIHSGFLSHKFSLIF